MPLQFFQLIDKLPNPTATKTHVFHREALSLNVNNIKSSHCRIFHVTISGMYTLPLIFLSHDLIFPSFFDVERNYMNLKKIFRSFVVIGEATGNNSIYNFMQNEYSKENKFACLVSPVFR